MTKEPRHLIKSLYAGFTIFLIIIFIFVLYIRFRLIFVYYSDIGGIESNVIYSIQRFLAGFPLYDNPEISPFSITQYSPLYYRVAGLIARVFDCNPDNLIEIYRVSRALSLLTNLLYAFLIFKIGRIFGLKFLTSLCLALMAFVLLPPHLYSRPDSFSTLFSLAVLYGMLLYINETDIKKSRIYLIAIIVLISCGVAAKQSSVVLPLIVCSYFLFFERSLIKTLLIAVAISGFSLIFLFVIMPEHDLGLLYLNNIIGVKQGLDWNAYASSIFLYYFRTFALINAIGIVASLWLVISRDKRNVWLGWFALVFFLFSCLTSLKQGSALNYFTEFVSLSPLMGVLYVKKAGFNLSKVALALLLTVSGLWIIFPNVSNFTWKYAFLDSYYFKESYSEQEKIRDYLVVDLGMTSTDRVFVTLHNSSFLNGFLYKNCVLPQQEIVTVMYPRGDLDYKKLDEDVIGQRIRFIVTQSEEKEILFPEKLSLENYVVKKKFIGFDVYECKRIGR
jgi:hypothetical protein